VLFFGFLGDPSEVHALKLVGTILSSFIFACVLGAAGGLAWLFVLNHVRQLKNTAFAVFAWIFIIYGVTDILGFSGAIAAMAFGAALTNHERLPLHNLKIFHQRELGKIEQSDTDFYHEVIFLLKTIFFVYLGLSIKFNAPHMLSWALLAVIVIYTIRTLIVRFVMRASSPGWQESFAQSVMAPKGLAAAVLAAVPAERGIANGALIQDFAYFGVLVSIVMTACLIPLQRQPAIAGGIQRFFGLPSEGRSAAAAPSSID
jgi:NhaP-type Na+/H+ or K+/H+ antiporter